MSLDPESRVIAIAAGGTGGHIIPALAVAEQLSKRGCKVEFYGVGRELESKLIEGAGFKLHVIPSAAIRGQGITGIIRLLKSFGGSLRAARGLLKSSDASCLFAAGGYPSFFPVLAAKLLGIPVILHEQNREVGIANKVLAIFANKIFGVPGVRGFILRRPYELPLPVREQFFSVPAVSEKQQLQILVTGGSQGAVGLNSIVLTLAPLFVKQGVKLVHQTGNSDYERILAEYTKHNSDKLSAVKFIENMSAALAESTLFIGRAGAMSVAETTASGRAAIYVPLPIAGGHQEANAVEQVRAGAAYIISQADAQRGELYRVVEGLIGDPGKILEMGGKARELAGVVNGSANQLAEAILSYS